MLKQLTYKNQEYFYFHEISIPVPDGYQYCEDGFGENSNWSYIVPEQYSLLQNHIDASPYCFGIGSSPSSTLPDIVDPTSTDLIKDILVRFGAFDSSIDVVEHICSSNCYFLYQNWCDAGDKLWNEIKGFLILERDIYQFHIYANHDKPIAKEQNTIDDFQYTIAEDWMAHIKFGTLDGQDDQEDIFDDELKAVPDKKLYPHYASKLDMKTSNKMGFDVLSNESNMDYRFIPIREIAEECEDNNILSTLHAIMESESMSDFPYEEIEEMSQLFHVNEEFFNENHDREYEINNGYLQKAYMFNALRSFSWTLMGYCLSMDYTNSGKVDIEILKNIVNFCADSNWLNYEDGTFSVALSSGADLHVYYVPDSILDEARRVLGASVEQVKEIEKIKQKFPSFREILPDVQSLSDLQDELFFMLNAIKALYNELKKNRNYDEELTGNIADIVYAYCAIAMAAKEPFFTEDGPSKCFFTQCQNKTEAPEVNKSASNDFKITKSEIEDSVNVSEELMDDPQEFVIEDGVLLEYNGNATTVVLPQGIKAIGLHSCEFREWIESVIIPEGVEVIESYAFNGCDNLENVELPSTLKRIEEHSFNGCGKLTNITIPEGCEEIGEECFSYCFELIDVKIPESFVIGKNIFKHCDDIIITRYRMGKMGDMEILDKRPLEMSSDYLHIDSLGTLTKIDSYDKYICLPDGIKKIEQQAFYYKPVEWVVLPDGLNCIGKGAFEGCSDLKQVYFPPSLKNTGEHAFKGCGFETLEIPASINKISKNSFEYCNNLKSLKIMDGVKTIDDKAFIFCESLEMIELASTIRELGVNCFYATNIKTVRIPKGCEEIGEGCFNGCDELESIYIPASVRTIGENAICIYNDNLIIHTSRGSAADRYAEKNDLMVKYDY